MLLYQILSFLLDTAVTIVGGACLLRLAMQRQRVPFGNQVGQLLFAVTDWIVLPLRRALPKSRGWDGASLLAAYLLVLAKLLLLWGLMGARTPLAFLPVVSLFGLAQLAISVTTALLVVFALLSWLQPQSPVMAILGRICAPLLAPLQRLLPSVAGFDFSPLVMLLILQVLGMLLAGLQGEALRLLPAL